MGNKARVNYFGMSPVFFNRKEGLLPAKALVKTGATELTQTALKEVTQAAAKEASQAAAKEAAQVAAKEAAQAAAKKAAQEAAQKAAKEAAQSAAMKASREATATALAKSKKLLAGGALLGGAAALNQIKVGDVNGDGIEDTALTAATGAAGSVVKEVAKGVVPVVGDVIKEVVPVVGDALKEVVPVVDDLAKGIGGSILESLGVDTAKISEYFGTFSQYFWYFIYFLIAMIVVKVFFTIKGLISAVSIS